MDWFKLSSNGILRGSLATSSDITQLVWIKLLALMSETHFRNGRFEFAPGKPYPIKLIAMDCGVTIKELQKCLSEYESDINPNTNLPRIQWDNGTLVLTNWLAYQVKPETRPARPPMTERQAKGLTVKLSQHYPDSAIYGIRSVRGRNAEKAGE